MDTQKFKTKLEEELKVLEKELGSIGRRNPDNKDDWEAVPDQLNVTGADKNESADMITEFEENTAKVKQLEIRYNNVKRALEKIREGKYGVDEIDGEPIPIERLEANPAARTKIENTDKVEG